MKKLLAVAMAIVMATSAVAQQAPPTPLFGANLSGAEARGTDATRPAMDDWKNYIDRYGFKLIRYPFKMERMTESRIVELQERVAYARSRGVKVILDHHNFAWPSVEEQIASWTRLASRFPNDGSVMLDLNNEPKGFNDPVLTNNYMQWARDAKLIIAGLRANGIKHPILLEWPEYSGISRFDKSESSKKACESAACALKRTAGVLDPINATYMNGHRYFDKDGSGTKADATGKNAVCAKTTSNFASFAIQLRRHGYKGYITESAFGSYRGVPSSCEAVGVDAVKSMYANSDVLLGVTWWGGGGKVWPEGYIFKIDCAKAERFTCPINPYLARLAGK